MAGMKISLESAMRARDVSRPRAADDAAAERTEAAAAGSKPGSGPLPAPNGRPPATTPRQETSQAEQSQANGADRRAARAAGGRSRARRRRPAPPAR